VLGLREDTFLLDVGKRVFSDAVEAQYCCRCSCEVNFGLVRDTFATDGCVFVPCGEEEMGVGVVVGWMAGGLDFFVANPAPAGLATKKSRPPAIHPTTTTTPISSSPQGTKTQPSVANVEGRLHVCGGAELLNADHCFICCTILICRVPEVAHLQQTPLPLKPTNLLQGRQHAPEDVQRGPCPTGGGLSLLRQLLVS